PPLPLANPSSPAATGAASAANAAANDWGQGGYGHVSDGGLPPKPGEPGDDETAARPVAPAPNTAWPSQTGSTWPLPPQGNWASSTGSAPPCATTPQFGSPTPGVLGQPLRGWGAPAASIVAGTVGPFGATPGTTTLQPAASGALAADSDAIDATDP